jgi:hypothetical protein
MLPLEMIFGYLENISSFLVLNIERKAGGKEPEMLNVLIVDLT